MFVKRILTDLPTESSTSSSGKGVSVVSVDECGSVYATLGCQTRVMDELGGRIAGASSSCSMNREYYSVRSVSL